MSDESTFSLDGRINQHNCVIWSDTNPHCSVTKLLHSPWVMVWIAFSPSLYTPPFFFEDNVTGESYSCVVNHHLVPFLKKKESCLPQHFSMMEHLPTLAFKQEKHFQNSSVTVLLVEGLMFCGHPDPVIFLCLLYTSPSPRD